MTILDRAAQTTSDGSKIQKIVTLAICQQDLNGQSPLDLAPDNLTKFELEKFLEEPS